MIVLQLVVFAIITILSSALEEDKCQNDLDNALKELQRKIDNPPKYKAVPQLFMDFGPLIKKATSIRPNMAELQAAVEKLKTINGRIQTVTDKLIIVQEVQDVLKQLRETRKEVDICTKADSDLEALKSLMGDIDKAGKAIKDTLEKNADRSDKITKYSIELMRDVEGLKSFTDYQCDKRIQESIGQTLDEAEMIVPLLKDMFDTILVLLQKKINITLPNPGILSSKETAALLEKLKNVVNDLRKRISDIKGKQAVADEIKKRFDDRAKDIEKLLALIFSKENIAKAQMVVETRKSLLELATLRDKARKDLDHLKEKKAYYEKQGPCDITINQSFES